MAHSTNISSGSGQARSLPQMPLLPAPSLALSTTHVTQVTAKLTAHSLSFLKSVLHERANKHAARLSFIMLPVYTRLILPEGLPQCKHQCSRVNFTPHSLSTMLSWTTQNGFSSMMFPPHRLQRTQPSTREKKKKTAYFSSPTHLNRATDA